MSTSEAILQACGYKIEKPISVVKQKKYAPTSIQGIGYIEEGVINLDRTDFSALSNELGGNKSYEAFVIDPNSVKYLAYKQAKYRKMCILNSAENTVEYSLTYW